MPSIMTGKTCRPDVVALETTRKRLGLSRAELCRRLGVRPSTYNRYLHGAEMPISIQDSVRAMCYNGAPDIWQ